MNHSLTLAELQRWEDNGATWRAVGFGDGYVVLELCACHGEPMELARSAEPELLEYVRLARQRT